MPKCKKTPAYLFDRIYLVYPFYAQTEEEELFSPENLIKKKKKLRK